MATKSQSRLTALAASPTESVDKMSEKPGILPELIIPIASVAFALYYMSTVLELPFQAKLVGVSLTFGLILLTLILFVRFVLEIRRGEKEISFNGFFSSAEFEAKRFSVLGMTILFIAMMPFLGFAAALFLFIFGNIIILGGIRRVGLAVVTATTLTAIGFSVFILAVGVRFPLSVLDRTLLGWVQ
jgi:hypothetical protein